MAFLSEHDSKTMASLQTTLGELAARESEEHSRLSLGQLLRRANGVRLAYRVCAACMIFIDGVRVVSEWATIRA